MLRVSYRNLHGNFLFLHRASGRTEIEKERDGEFVKVRRLEKTCDKYSRQLDEARAEIVELKAQLLESTKIQVRYRTVKVKHCCKP